MPQPNFVPVSSATSRKYQSSGISRSPSNVFSCPFTFNRIICPPMNHGCCRMDLHILVAEREMWKSGRTDWRQPLTETLTTGGHRGTQRNATGASYNASDITGGILAYDDLRDWIQALDRAGELKRIRTEADPILEIAEITDRVSKSKDRQGTVGGKALLFENLKGHPGSRLLINQFGSARRMRLALEVDMLDEIAERIRGFMDVKSPQGLLDKVKMLPMLAEIGKFFPKTVATGPCKEVIKRDNFSLLDFPILQCWPQDAGRFITLPCVITRDPKTGKRNVGMYRMQIYDERTTGMHWQRQKVAAEHSRAHTRQAAAKDRVGTGDLARPVGQSPATAAVDIMARSS